MEKSIELTAGDALMNQMGTVHEHMISLLEDPNLDEEGIKKAKEYSEIFLNCYDRMTKDNELVDEKKDKNTDRWIKIGLTVVTGVVIPIGVAIFTGKHSERIALAESVSMIGAKEGFRATEKAFNDSLKAVGKVIN